MSKFLKWTAWTALVLLIASLVTGGLLMGLAHEGLSQAGNWHVVVDGQEVFDGDVHEALGELGEAGELGFFGLLGAALAVGFTLLVVLPLCLIVGVGVPVIAVVLALSVVALSLAGVAALVAAPLLLPILLVVWLLRRDRRERQTKVAT